MNDTTTDTSQADDLADLLAGATQLDGAGQQVAQAQAMAQVDEKARALQLEQQQAEAIRPDLLGALHIVRAPAAAQFAWWPRFGEVWSDATLDAIATHGAVIMVRHGLTMHELMGRFAPYLGLLMALGPAALQTYQAVQARQRQAQGVPGAVVDAAPQGGAA